MMLLFLLSVALITCVEGRYNQPIKTKNCTGDCIPVDGNWGPWRNASNKGCLDTCKRIVKLERSCDSPPASNEGRYCLGSPALYWDVDCAGEYCEKVRSQFKGQRVDGNWGNWYQDERGPCTFFCIKMLLYTRECQNPYPSGGGKACIGAASTFDTALCDEDMCEPGTSLLKQQVFGTWSPWVNIFIGSACSVVCMRDVVTVRVCEIGMEIRGEPWCTGPSLFNSVRRCIGDDCPIKRGEWTEWKETDFHDCDECVVKTTFSRDCKAFEETILQHECVGRPVKVIKKPCCPHKQSAPPNAAAAAAEPESASRSVKPNDVLPYFAVGTVAVVMVVAGVIYLKRRKTSSDKETILPKDK